MAEEALRKANETSVYKSPVPIIASDIHGNVTIWNGAAEEVFGWAEQEVMGKPIPIIPADDRQQATRTYARMFAASTITALQVRRQRRDGSLVTISLSAAPLLDSELRVRGVIEFLTDITRNCELEEQLRQMQKIEAIGKLAGGVAHDFNNILMAISSYSELLFRKIPLGDPCREYAEEVMKATERGSFLTQGLLAFGRKQVVSPRVLDLNSLIDDQLSLLKRLIDENIELTFQPQVDLGLVCVDPGQMQQIVMNLVINARDAMPAGGTISVATSNFDRHNFEFEKNFKTDAHVVLTVGDNGCGMNADTKSHIFEPFFTTKGQGRGTGLGLATVLDIVQQSAGDIEVHSEPGRGSTFTIYLPRVAGVLEELGAPADEHIGVRGTETILLVEDEDSVREASAEYLRDNGYQVLKASCGAQALEVAKQYCGPIHLLLTDLVMPQMSGKELADHVTAMRQETSVVFMSGYSNDLLSNQQVLDPERILLQKPFRLEKLGRCIREYLDGQTLAAAK